MILYKMRRPEQIPYTFTIVDNDEILLKEVRKYKWHLSDNNYVINRSYGKTIRLHHLILPSKNGYLIDHINRQKLDNRRVNLRYGDKKSNNENSIKNYGLPANIRNIHKTVVIQSEGKRNG